MIGIDVGARRCHICERHPDQAHNEWSATPAQTIDYIQRATPTTVVLELTGYYGIPIAEAAADAGHTVLIAHDTDSAALRQLLRRRHKNDRLDAALLADLAELAEREPILTQRHLTPYTEIRPLLRVRRYAHAWRALTAIRARLRQRKRHPHTEPLLELEQELTRQLEHYAERTIAEVPPHVLELLTSIPGVTPRLAALLYATIGDIHRFRSTAAVVSYCGVAPKHQATSGTTSKRPRRHRYAVLLTTNLHMYALRVASAPDKYGRIGRTYQRVYQRAGGRSALHAVKRHLIRITAGVLRSQLPYDDEYPARARDAQQVTSA
jgi:transposase